jgi:hypothetical protein
MNLGGLTWAEWPDPEQYRFVIASALAPATVTIDKPDYGPPLPEMTILTVRATPAGMLPGTAETETLELCIPLGLARQIGESLVALPEPDSAI